MSGNWYSFSLCVSCGLKKFCQVLWTYHIYCTLVHSHTRGRNVMYVYTIGVHHRVVRSLRTTAGFYDTLDRYARTWIYTREKWMKMTSRRGEQPLTCIEIAAIQLYDVDADDVGGQLDRYLGIITVYISNVRFALNTLTAAVTYTWRSLCQWLPSKELSLDYDSLRS